MQTGIKLRILEAGSCVHPGFVVKPGSGIKPKKFPAGVALIKHPAAGYILFDTGYHEHFFTATRPFPERFYAWVTPCRFKAGQGVVAQLAQLGIAKDDIQHLILSHFHADHIAAVSEFTHSTIHCAQAGLNAILNTNRVYGVRKGYLRKLIPENIHQQIRTQDTFPIPLSQIIPALNGVELFCADLFNDSTVYLVNLPGHAAGQMGLLVRLQAQWVFLLADACWLMESLSESVNQHWLANILCDDVSAYRHTLTQLRRCYQLAEGDIQFVPSHCQRTINLLGTWGWMQ